MHTMRWIEIVVGLMIPIINLFLLLFLMVARRLTGDDAGQVATRESAGAASRRAAAAAARRHCCMRPAAGAALRRSAKAAPWRLTAAAPAFDPGPPPDVGGIPAALLYRFRHGPVHYLYEAVTGAPIDVEYRLPAGEDPYHLDVIVRLEAGALAAELRGGPGSLFYASFDDLDTTPHVIFK
ncbi:MAG: hypothetical protein ACKOSQ_10010, partial [Planctomycetaceae bacterium]